MARFGIEKRVDRSAMQSGSSRRGSYLYKPSADVWEVFVPYSKGYVAFKILPGLNPEDGGETLDPMVLPSGGFGSWQTSAPVVTCGTKEKQVTFCALTDFSNPDNVWDTPYYKAYTMVTRMAKLPQGDINRVDSWVSLLYGKGPMDPAEMQRPSDHTFVLCVVLADGRGRQDLEKTKGQLHVLNLKQMATRALRDAVNSCIASKIDLTNLQTGPIVAMWSGVASNPFTREPGNQDDRQYKAQLLDVLPTENISKDISMYQKDYLDKLLPWSYILNCPSMEQQALWCMEALPLDMLAQAWKDPMGNYLSFVSKEMALRLDEGCRLKWQQEQARREAQIAQFSRFQTNSAPQQAPQFSSNPVVQPTEQYPRDRVTPPADPDVRSSFPGLTPQNPKAPTSYPPVPDQFKSMLSDEIPFDTDDPDIEKL